MGCKLQGKLLALALLSQQVIMMNEEVTLPERRVSMDARECLEQLLPLISSFKWF